MEWVVALVGALVGGGGIAGMLVVIFSYRKCSQNLKDNFSNLKSLWII